MEVIFLNNNSLTENVKPVVKGFEKWGRQLNWHQIPHTINSLGKTVMTHLICSLKIISHDNFFRVFETISLKLMFWKCYKMGALSDCAQCSNAHRLAPAPAPSLQTATTQATVKQEKALRKACYWSFSSKFTFTESQVTHDTRENSLQTEWCLNKLGKHWNCFIYLLPLYS